MTSESVDTLTLLLPGLLANGELPAELTQHALANRFLAGTTKTQLPTASLESEVLKWFHGTNAATQNCAAYLGYRLDYPQAVWNGQILCIEPVYQQMDINHAVLADSSVLSLSESEARSIINDLNRHFIDDGLRFEYAAPHRWYSHFESSLDLNTQAPGVATGHDVSMMMPRGADARRWRGILAEIEMLLHSHQVNEQRVLQGKTPVNSLWIWGEGVPSELPEPGHNNVQCFSEQFYTRSVADYCQSSCLPLSQLGDIAKGNAVLLVDDRFAVARATGDQQMHASLLEIYDKEIFKPLIARRWRDIALWGGGEYWRYKSRNKLMNAWQNWFMRAGRAGA